MYEDSEIINGLKFLINDYNYQSLLYSFEQKILDNIIDLNQIKLKRKLLNDEVKRI